MMRKRKHKWKPCDICSLIYRNQRREFIMKILNSIFLCSVFNSLERIYIESEHMDLS